MNFALLTCFLNFLWESYCVILQQKSFELGASQLIPEDWLRQNPESNSFERMKEVCGQKPAQASKALAQPFPLTEEYVVGLTRGRGMLYLLFFRQRFES